MKTIPPKLLAGVSHEFPIECLLVAKPTDTTVAAERQLLGFVLPHWQRDEVWETERKQRFIEGIFLGLGTGTYVVHQSDWDANGTAPMSGWLIDGQQRLSAIRDFAFGDLTIFDGVRYGDLDPITLKRRFKHVVFPSIEVNYQGDEAVLRELYDRLNYGGVNHTQEDRDRLSLPPLTTQSGFRRERQGN